MPVELCTAPLEVGTVLMELGSALLELGTTPVALATAPEEFGIALEEFGMELDTTALVRKSALGSLQATCRLPFNKNEEFCAEGRSSAGGDGEIVVPLSSPPTFADIGGDRVLFTVGHRAVSADCNILA